MYMRRSHATAASFDPAQLSCALAQSISAGCAFPTTTARFSPPSISVSFPESPHATHLDGETPTDCRTYSSDSSLPAQSLTTSTYCQPPTPLAMIFTRRPSAFVAPSTTSASR